MAQHVFISYSREDRGYVLSLAQHLEAQGVPVWVDRDPNGSDRQLAECAALVLVMTPSAQASPAVVAEVRQARSLGKPIVPLLLQGTTFYGAGQIPYEDVQGGTMPSYGVVQQLLAASAAGAAAPAGTYAGGQASYRPATTATPAPTAAQPSRVQPTQARTSPPSLPRQAPPPPPPPPTRVGSYGGGSGGGGGGLPSIRVPGFRYVWRALLRFGASMLAIWLTTLLISGVQINTDDVKTKVLTLAVVSVLFGVANSVLRPVIKMVGCGFYIMTLGLISFVVNGGLLWLVSFVAGKLDYPFHVENLWPSAILGAVVIGLFGWVLNLVIVPKR